mmetsp:Transcript_251/g.513  ORF Transcript_251/g.513 Transcript_251/m.513 type:complete len:465 (-) Transcript_251:2551-3945(-)
MPLGLEHGHPLLRVVGGVWAEDPAVGERTLRLDAEGVLVRVGRVVEVDALDEVAELEALQLRVHALVLELAQRVVGHERNVDPRELIVLLVLVVLLLLRVRRRRGLGLGGGLGLVLLLLLLAAGEGEGAREGGDALLYGVGARELLVVDLRGLVDLDAHLHPLRLDHVVAAARRLDALHLGQADPRLQHLDPLGRHGRLARAELPLALGRVERDAVLGALGLAVALLDAHGLVERDLDALAVGLGGVFVVVVVGELCLLDQGVLVLPRLRLHLEHEPAPLPRLAHGHAELGLLALLEEPARLERLLRFLDGNLLLRLDGRLDAVHVERREQLTHLTLAGGAHAQHRAVCCLEEQAPLVEVDALGAHGGAHVGDGEGNDGLRHLGLCLLLLRVHVEHRVAQHEPVAHPLLRERVVLPLVLLGQVEPALGEHAVDHGAHLLLRGLRGVERGRPLQHVLLVVGGEQP